MLVDYIPYSHDLSDGETVDITKRNLTLITIGASRAKRLFTLSFGFRSLLWV